MNYQWTQSTPPSDVWSYTDLAYHLRIDADVIAQTAEQNYLLDLQAAAVEYAETAMATSLLTRTITATYYDMPAAVAYFNITLFYDYRNRLYLPRGPIVSITSVTDSTDATIQYQPDGAGGMDMLKITSTYVPPLTVVYQAGYGSTAASVPPDITHAIRAHVALLYERRESAGDRTITEVPQSLRDFYALKRRAVPVG